ncbi:T9SS type A sorting domain-containing protein, partial [bacterium]|nr:T9SS type A sorting domain-containing protein [bacterium]
LSLYQDSLSTIRNNFFNVSGSWEKIGNLNTGVWLTNGSHDNSVRDNKIGFCELYAIGLQDGAVRNKLSRNLVTGNDFTGIYLSLGTNNNISAPVITAALSDKVEGHAGPGNVIEIFNDENGQAKEYIGKTTADNAGNFSLNLSSVPALSNITATATDADSNTSALSGPMEISQTSIEYPAVISERRYYLRQNFPNPFNPSTTISFGLAQSGPVDIRVYNLRGEEVALLMHKNITSGTHRVVFDGSSLPTGVYLVRLCAGKFESIVKILLVR